MSLITNQLVKENMTPKIMTVHQAFNVAMNLYPALYSSPTLGESKIKYYGHMFNVIGNGYRTLEDFIERHTINKENIVFIDSFPDKYVGTIPLYYAYTEVENRFGMKMGLSDSLMPGVYTKKELASMPSVQYSLQSNKVRKEDTAAVYQFYPNFQKEYSMAWKYISSLDVSWARAALEFYKEAQLFFKSENVHNYYGACPQDGDAAEWKVKIKEYEVNFEKYKKPAQSLDEYYSSISKEYDVPYNGDTKEFIKARWAQEHARINAFLVETIDMLEVLIEPGSIPKIKVK